MDSYKTSKGGYARLKRTLSDEAKKAIEKVISCEDRAEIIPIKNGEVKVIHITRKEVKA